MNFINLTPHSIFLNDGTEFPPSGKIARVSVNFSEFDNKVAKQSFGEVEGIPEPEPNTMFIVSAVVLSATTREDVVAPATGHPQCVRESGFIKSVPGFVQ